MRSTDSVALLSLYEFSYPTLILIVLSGHSKKSCRTIGSHIQQPCPLVKVRHALNWYDATCGVFHSDSPSPLLLPNLSSSPTISLLSSPPLPSLQAPLLPSSLLYHLPPSSRPTILLTHTPFINLTSLFLFSCLLFPFLLSSQTIHNIPSPYSHQLTQTWSSCTP